MMIVMVANQFTRGQVQLSFEGTDPAGVHSVFTQMLEMLEKQHPELKNNRPKKPSGLILPATAIPKSVLPGGMQ
jgi:hypothetical protein